jgi:DNA-binding MarR family transcriptional regulator
VTPGVTPSRQSPAAATVRVSVIDQTPSQLWETIATADDFQRALVEAVRELLAGTPHYARHRVLEDAGVTAAQGLYARVLCALDRPAEHERYQEALTTTARFGAADPSLLGHLALEAISDGPLAIFEAAEYTPTIAIRLPSGIRERSFQERDAVLALLARLGQACDVRVITSALTARWLAREHRETLPAAFSESVDAHREEALPVEETIAAARDELAPDSRAVALLRTLAAEPGETLPYRELVASATVSKSRVSQLLGTLEELTLVERFGPRTDQRVELSPAGSAFVDALDAEIGRQSELDAPFSETGKKRYRPCNHAHAREGGRDGPAPEPKGRDPYRTRYLNRAAHAAAGAVAEDGAITAVDADFEDAHDRMRKVSYADGRDEVVVAVTVSSALQCVVSTALSLASPRLFDRALPVSRLEEIDTAAAVLRDGRCIGGLSDEAAADPEKLRDNLVEWGAELAEMTTDLRNGEYEDRDRFRGDIMRSAHGLAGAIVHLLDVAGVDVVREYRIPEDLPHHRLAELAETIAVSTAIQAEYDDCTLYRQVFEQRPDKRRAAKSVDVDTTAPFGRFIGGIALRGPDAHRLAHHVEGRLAAPASLHEDAPEIAVQVPVQTPNRTTYAEAVARIGRHRNLTPTSEAVTIYRALTGSPYTVTDAMHWLSSESIPREIRLDEVRFSLAQLDATRILPGTPPTVGKAIQALLRSTSALTQTELAEAAGVSARSVRTYTDILVALDLIRKTDEGLRFALPTHEEIGDQIRPAVLDDQLAARQDLLFDIALTLVDDPSPELYSVFTGAAYDEQQLQQQCPRIRQWIRVARALCDDPELPATTVTVGNPTAQAALALEAVSGVMLS